MGRAAHALRAGLRHLERTKEGDWLGVFDVVRVWEPDESSYVGGGA